MFEGCELFVEDDFRGADAVEGDGVVEAGVGRDQIAQRRLGQRLRQVQILPLQIGGQRIDVLMLDQVVHGFQVICFMEIKTIVTLSRSRWIPYSG